MKPTIFLSVRAEAMSRLIMLRIVQLICVVMMLGAGARSAFGFALVGPPEAYQAGTGINTGIGLGYDRTEEFDYPATFYTQFFVDWRAAPKNIGEGYRWNIPI